MHGHKVLLLEKEKFPRYHIGESLLPFGYFPLQRIGMIEKLKKSHFPRKYAVQFASQDGRVSAPFYFHKHLQHEAAVTWQVVRGEFDQMLLENAREKGRRGPRRDQGHRHPPRGGRAGRRASRPPARTAASTKSGPR